MQINNKAGSVPSANVIEVESVGFAYNGENILENVSFTVPRGEYLGIIGPNGAGKTTLLRILLGLLSPSSGKVRLFGQEIGSYRKWHKIGYVPQRVGQIDAGFPISVHEAISQGRIAGIGLFRRFSQEDRDAIEAAMETTEVAELKDHLVSDLSGGERQRVFIARALASRPEVLILDEPAISIDVKAQEHLYNLLKRLNQEQDITIVFVSHDIDVIVHEATDIVCLNREMVCHMHPKNLTELDIKQLFGETVRPIRHRDH